MPFVCFHFYHFCSCSFILFSILSIQSLSTYWYGDISCCWLFGSHHHGQQLKDNLYLWTMFMCYVCFSTRFLTYIQGHLVCLITWFRVRFTKFLPPPPKGANGWSALAIITVLVIVWVTTLKTPFSCQKPQVLLSRLWKRSIRFSTLSLNVHMFLHCLFHWIVWFFLKWLLDIPCFFTKITNIDFSIYCPIVTNHVT